MGKKVIQLFISAVVTGGLFILLSISLGSIPPLGPLLNPTSGFWANAVTSKPAEQTIQLPENAISDSVHVYIDKHQIPHIFAQNSKDLYFAQGYLTARDRLWQMEMQTHAAAGRLSEILGERTVAYDRYQRHIGMGYAAELALQKMMDNPATASALTSYARGVNAWINQLETAKLPLEYKVLDYTPEKWTPLKTALLLKRMTYTLAGSNQDLKMSNTRAFFGDQFIKEILNVEPRLNDPTIPAEKKWNFEPHSVQQPDSSFTPSIVDSIPPFQPDPLNGSNNWAVSGSKTASGYPILANDPHLNMTLPSIWYAMQLHTPDQNTMGVSLPGAPAIIIGFNENIAWGTTNVSADVWDWYEIQFRDSTLSEYRYDDSWEPTSKRIERIKVKGEPTIIDTVVYTHHGPIVQSSGASSMRPNVPKRHAMRWIAFEDSNEMRFFLEMNKANSYTEYQQALTHYQSPAQNWVYADSSNIALTVAGKYPLKWKGQGRFISDGTDPKYDWQGWIPFEQIPSIKNPERGFVSSANQDPVHNSYPYYLDDDFAPFERGRRINDRLASMDSITAKDMQKLQMDNYSYHAQSVLPLLLKHLRTDTLTGIRQKAVQKLLAWELHNNGNQIAPSLFHAWWDAFYQAIWADEYRSANFPMQWPARDQTVELIKRKPDLSWLDNIHTSKRESLTHLANTSFSDALQKLQQDYGSFGNNWKWGHVNNTSINHLGQIPGLGRKNLFTDGAGESINAVRGNHGPSWRMVVELGPKVKAYGLYPGGQSGNPGSPYYDNMIDEWINGELYPLRFMLSQPVSTDSTMHQFILR